MCNIMKILMSIIIISNINSNILIVIMCGNNND